jgi:tRNA(Ile2)-agmatinylcytidine synthase
MVKLHIGFDDTDSPNGGCTTYIAAILVEKFCNMGISFNDYPRLIRLNPNVPWKTRGNGALCLTIECPEDILTVTKETVITTVEAHSELSDKGTHPGIVFVYGDVTSEIFKFAKKAEQTLLTIEEASKLAKKVNAETVEFKKGRGIIGSLAAIGENLNEDHTFEIISYRIPENRNKPRRVQVSSVKSVNHFSPLTFNNIDSETGRILITPRGPDPILCGIRGETPEAVRQAYEMIKINEPVERWMIFRTNQGTDSHLRKIRTVDEIKPYNPVVVQGIVSKQPRVVQGGHVIFAVKDETGEVDCAAYAPTGTLCKIARKLITGDVLKVYGGVSYLASEHRMTINLEKMNVLELAHKSSFINPDCPDCRKRMSSMGTNKGFRCDKCGFRSTQLKKVEVNEKRGLEKGLFITSPRSQRHLTKPHRRYGREKAGPAPEMIEQWHYP